MRTEWQEVVGGVKESANTQRSGKERALCFCQKILYRPVVLSFGQIKTGEWISFISRGLVRLPEFGAVIVSVGIA
jgi:hypothetical protein